MMSFVLYVESHSACHLGFPAWLAGTEQMTNIGLLSANLLGLECGIRWTGVIDNWRRERIGERGVS